MVRCDMTIGECACGCGQITPIATHNRADRGWVKGEHRPFVHGHHTRVNHPMQGKKHTNESKAKISAGGVARFEREAHPMQGKTHTAEARERMSAAAQPGVKRGPQPDRYGEGTPSYAAVHRWMTRHHPRSGTCEACGVGRVTHWANISGENRRDPEDFWELCVPCHKLFDYIKRLDEVDPALVAVLRERRHTVNLRLKDDSEA